MFETTLTAPFTLFHVLISLVAIVAGVFVVRGLWRGQLAAGWTTTFLITTLATILTGFLFRVTPFTPAQIVGIVALVVFILAAVALYVRRLEGASRWGYVVAAVVSFYLNAFVLVVQAFQKVPFLHRLAPQGNEPPFAVAQAILLGVFAWAGFVAVRRFRPSPLELGKTRPAL